ncbi:MULTISPECIES: ATP-binding cassette domain-containing protein [Micrococcaceae]|uniref:ATP-binding cassette domain-containing protein n=1 Tax=Micrococcaceae TaxID=1268 RepID=UPI001D001379|nr:MULTISPECIES: ATP-binding cassette domain-containing protein [Micrococcaceae]MCB5283707.1 putative ABC transporter ATP-binding protein [Arthrobacter sp. ES1]MDJ0354020.1 ATP-binding cassette domain-containing protein [Pseudarthrobacter sp. PH31-O2]WGZ80882.1 ATP-binding cassette domain-containing protein [Arthrobacter sp. EM1]
MSVERQDPEWAEHQGAPLLLEVNDLNVTYRGRGFRGRSFHALKDVSIQVRRGETIGLVGESGSGKTTLGRAVLGLVPVTSGSVVFEGEEISHVGGRRRRQLSRDIQVVFQDPYSSLNPAMTIESILAEPLTVRGYSGTDARARVAELLDHVHLPADAAQRYPREFSGGQRQRVAIARALALAPKLIVCDEPVSALDLSTQARILDLFIDIQEQTGVAYLFISHDLSVVRYIAHRVAVMLSGEIIETGDGDVVTTNPTEPYTQRLLLASPVPDPVGQAKRRDLYMSLGQPQK